MTQFHITLPQFLISEGQKQKTSILVSTVEVSCCLASWTKIHRSIGIILLQKNLKAYSKKGGSASAVVRVTWSQQQRFECAARGELQSSGQKTKSQIPTHSHRRTLCPLKRFSYSVTPQFMQVKVPSSFPITHWKAVTFFKKCLSLHWQCHYTSNEVHNKKVYHLWAAHIYFMTVKFHSLWKLKAKFSMDTIYVLTLLSSFIQPSCPFIVQEHLITHIFIKQLICRSPPVT